MSDAWILQTIMYTHGKGGGSLLDLITVGYGINQAFFTYDELEKGLKLLISSGLVEENRDTRMFDVTDLFRKTFKHENLSVHEEQAELHDYLQAIPVHLDRMKAVELHSLSLEEYNEALETYTKRLKLLLP